MHLGLRLQGRAVGAVADPGTDAVAVLASGGLDSAILVGQLAREGREVTPIYVRFGLAWEDVELRYLRKFLVSLGPRGQSLSSCSTSLSPISTVNIGA